MPYFRMCTKFFTKFDLESKPGDYLLINRSFRLYQEGEKINFKNMTAS